MIKGLLALDENLASSIALRYASQLACDLPLFLQIGHVEEPDSKQHASGTGWVSRTWEKGVKDAALQTIQRLLKTEKVSCPLIGRPKVFVGDRDKEFLEELRNGQHDLFIEGNLNTSDINNFHKLISSSLYSNSPCPVMVVKNLVKSDTVCLLCGDGVNHHTLIPKVLSLLKSKALRFDLIFFRYQEMVTVVSDKSSETSSELSEAENIMRNQGINIEQTLVVSGTPETVADMLTKYRLVASSLPVRKSPMLDLLARCPSPILLCKP